MSTLTITKVRQQIEYDPKQFAIVHGLPRVKVQPEKIRMAQNWCQSSQKHHLICFDDPFYPPLLKQISDPPSILFVKGQIDILLQPGLAIVGSRYPSHSGIQITQHLTEQLANSALMICSGLAAGIDGAAHRAALAANGKTIAVLGTGIDVIYPKRHIKLAEQITEQGCLISEFWPDIQPFAGNFPKRNRIISGICMGTLVVEAKLKSGSLITARLAAEQGREVFAVPGNILAGQNQGCHKLIKNGAKLIEAPVDIIEELEFICSEHLNNLPLNEKRDNELCISQLPFSSLLASVNYEVTSLDEVVEHSAKTLEVVLEQLLELELQGLIAAVPGGYIRLKRN